MKARIIIFGLLLVLMVIILTMVILHNHKDKNVIVNQLKNQLSAVSDPNEERRVFNEIMEVGHIRRIHCRMEFYDEKDNRVYMQQPFGPYDNIVRIEFSFYDGDKAVGDMVKYQVLRPASIHIFHGE